MPTSTKPSLRFYHSKRLRVKTLKVLDSIERDEDPTQHSGALGEVVMELTTAGMDFYFLQPIEMVKMGFLLRQSANVGITGILSIMSPMIRNAIGRMDSAQLRKISKFIRQLM